MKRIYSLLALMAVALCVAAQSISVGGYNIRYANSGDARMGNAWSQRVPRITSLANYESWDVLAMQEVLHAQLQDLRQGLKDYDYVGVGRDDGATKGEYAPIFYKKSRVRCINHGTFWLSETPDVVGSKGWDAALPRICTWAYLEDKTTKWKFYIFNLHLDHKGQEARVQSARLLLKKIEEMCGDTPFVVTGDFNVNQHSDVYAELTQSAKLFDTFHKARHRMAENGSYNGFGVQNWTDNRIDHIFVSKQFSVHRYGILTPFYWSKDDKENKYIVRHVSDHFPISATLELPRLRAPQDWAQYGNFEKKNQEQKKAKVVFMGNSITYNWYRFHKEFFEQHKGYVCRGISGQVTAQMLARFRSDVINLRPDTVVILAGTNDIAMNQGYVSIEHIFENLVSMTELALYNDIDVVLCSVLPADRYSWSWEIDRERAIKSICELNAKIKAYAKKKGIRYADYFSEMVDENQALRKEYQQDPVHPNLEGYYVMEKVIRQVLKSKK